MRLGNLLTVSSCLLAQTLAFPSNPNEHRLAPRTVEGSGPQPEKLSGAELTAQMQQLEARMGQEEVRIRELVKNNRELQTNMKECLDRATGDAVPSWNNCIDELGYSSELKFNQELVQEIMRVQELAVRQAPPPENTQMRLGDGESEGQRRSRPLQFAMPRLTPGMLPRLPAMNRQTIERAMRYARESFRMPPARVPIPRMAAPAFVPMLHR